MKKNLLGLALAAVSLTGAVAIPAPSLFAQAISINGGSIQGTVTDPSGARVPNAEVTITGTDTGVSAKTHTDASGFYAAGPLNPGRYSIQIVAPGFQQLTVNTTVSTGTATSGNAKLTLGDSGTTVEVTTGDVRINTDQATVSGVLNSKDFDQLPVNGRNFLDYAQLQPGVQLQNADYSAGGFDPTKAGYSALSFSGVSGRTTRILLDGQDITDENVGSTIINVPSGAVGEMQVNRSTADPSVPLTSSGSVVASTRSGTNSFHGNAFYNFQDHRALFARVKGQDAPFQRNQFGGYFGGPLIKDKLFFYGGGERIKQDLASPSAVLSTGLFASLLTTYPQVSTPARDTFSQLRLDYNGPHAIHMFARAAYEVNSFTAGIGPGYYQPYANRDNVPSLAGGADFVTGRFTHSLRASYEKFHNLLVDATLGNNGIYNPFPGVGVSLTSQGLRTGGNPNAPQQTFQSDKQVRYDGSFTRGAHNIRFGGEMNRILAGGFASFYSQPYIVLSTSSVSQFKGGTGKGCNGVVGAAPCASDLVNGYHPYYALLGNGQGLSTEIPQFGFPGGGQGDWRIGIYINDTWKMTPNFTLTFGARYNRDTGRTDSDLQPLLCSTIDPGTFPNAPCTGSAHLLDLFGPGLGDRINQPNKNVGPQIGFNYAPPAANGKTSLRGGFGVFFENSVFNNILFDRPYKLQTGRFFADQPVCGPYGNSVTIPGRGQVTTTPDGTSIATVCGAPMRQAAPEILALSNQLKSASASSVGANPNYIGNFLETTDVGATLFAPNQKTPYSLNMNFGIQQQIAKGVVVTADYVHIGTLRIAQSIDANHVGDASTLNATAARNAVLRTAAGFGCTATGVTAAADCAIANGATISDFASNGLGTTTDPYLQNYPYEAYPGLTANTGAAFAGNNPAVGVGNFSFPNGKSGYDGLQLNLRQQATHPLPGILASTVEVSYAYSRFISTSGAGSSDQFFLAGTFDQRNPTRYIGYGGLDRTHILSFGLTSTIKYGPRLSFIGHFESPTATNLTLDTQDGGGVGQIFQTDFTGDGTTGDLLPGTNPGSYMRKVHPGDVGNQITQYNAKYANQLTPAGQALVNAGVLNLGQMRSIGAVMPTLRQPGGAVFQNSPYRQLDASLAYPINHSVLRFLPESVSLEPQVNFYNALNLANYGGPSGVLTSVNTGSVTGDVNADVTNAFLNKNNYRTVRGIGTFSQGAPRTTEFQLRLNF
ncbi:TonB-dependent receptor [Terriglobus aquaticus]|uniref:Carboxypeptidase regulatory-like domain-containing protein n=1 Tax=Terriglobus aquaticus TaxID=940139 RepID=A0ABW9KPR4_9BACT|nr:carboxypeptidase-like regulatory domain-containing protein [Terriglobus aquaticus]